MVRTKSLANSEKAVARHASRPLNPDASDFTESRRASRASTVPRRHRTCSEPGEPDQSARTSPRYDSTGPAKLANISSERGLSMAQLLVRDLSDELIERLEHQAARNGRSVEEEHREILKAAFPPPLTASAPGKSFKEFLLSMPYAGEDGDFEFPRRSRDD